MMLKNHAVLVALLWTGLTSVAQAAWPQDKSIEIVIPYDAGGENDVITRALLPYVAKHLPGANFFVTNKPGASGEIGTTYVQRAKPDGYVLGIAAVPPLVFVPLVKKVNYDLAKVKLVARTMHDPTVLAVRVNSPIKDLKTMVDRGKAEARPLSVSNVGLGSHADLASILLQRGLNVDLIRVPYNGTGPAKIALMGEQIDMMMTTQSTVTSDTTGALRPIVQFASERAPLLSQVPTAQEQGLDIEMEADRGFIGPAGIAPDILSRIEKAVEDAVKDPAFLKASPSFAPIMRFATGEQWQAVADKRLPRLRELARNMPVN